MRMHETKELILIENLNLIIGTKRRWFEDENLKSLGRNLSDAKCSHKDKRPCQTGNRPNVPPGQPGGLLLPPTN